MRPERAPRGIARCQDGPARARGSVRIGCAGWSIPTACADRFEGGASHLARYASRFDCVEINSSFHRSHRVQTYERWAATVPEHFRFSVKLPKTIMHEARLVAVDALVAQFAAEVAGLGHKLGGILVQLPPSLVHEPRIANAFFRLLRKSFDVPLACEPRHASWFAAGIDAFWKRHNLARVAADPARPAEASEPGPFGPWRYWRWHGSPRMYYSAYDNTRLEALARELTARVQDGRDAWCIFDNTAAGHAIGSALRMRALLQEGC